MASKIIIVGDSNVGKTSLVKMIRNKEFEEKHIHTLGVEVSVLRIQNNTLNTWDTSGSERFGGGREGYYIGAKGAIIMFDVTNIDSYNNLLSWYTKVRNVCGDIPIVICGNKIDNEEIIDDISFHNDFNLHYCAISCKTNDNIEAPFSYLISQGL